MDQDMSGQPISVDVLRTPYAEDNAAYRYAAVARSLLEVRGNPIEVVGDMTAILEKLGPHELAVICAIAITEKAIGTALRCGERIRHVEHPWTGSDGERHICPGVRGDEMGRPPGGSDVASTAGP